MIIVVIEVVNMHFLLSVVLRDITEEATEHIRFSSASFEDIETNQNVSSNLILAIFETILLNTIGTDFNGQQTVKCKTVTP